MREIMFGGSWTQTNSATENPRGFGNVNVLAIGTTDKIALDYEYSTDTSSVTYSPLWSTSGTILQIAGGLVLGAPIWAEVPAASIWTPRRRGAGAAGVSQFASFPNALPEGWRIQDVQPPHPRPERAGVLEFYDDGVEAPFIYVPPKPFGWEATLHQPSHPRPERAGAVMPDAVYRSINFGPWWETPLYQPQHQRLERAGALMPIETGIEATYVVTPPVPATWEHVFTARPMPRRFVVYNEQALGPVAAAPSAIRWGYELQFQPPRRLFERGEAARGTSQFASFPPQLFAGWEVQPPQPPHPRPERAGVFKFYDDGVEAPFIYVPTPPFFGMPALDLLRKKPADISGGTGFGIPFAFIPWSETPSHNPPHPRPERAGALTPIETGTEAVFVTVPPPPITWAYEAHPQPPRRWFERREAARGVSQFASFPNPVPVSWWQILDIQPQHPRPERAGAIMPIEMGIEATFTLPPPPPSWWETPLYQPQHVRSERAGAFMPISMGIEAPYILPLALYHWDEKPLYQPQHLRPERAGAIMPIEMGIEAIYNLPPPLFPWSETPLYQPQHLARSERLSGAWPRGDEGIYGRILPPPIDGWEIQSVQPQHVAVERRGAWLKGDDGIQGTLVIVHPYGWEVQPVQPPHRAPEWRAGATMCGDDGTQAKFVKWNVTGWEIQPPPPPHRATERGLGSIARGDDGTAYPYLIWRKMGWEIAPHQPQHPRPERSGAIMAGHAGIDAKYILPKPLLAWGHEFLPLPRARPNLGALLDSARFDFMGPIILYNFPLYAVTQLVSWSAGTTVGSWSATTTLEGNPATALSQSGGFRGQGF
jgi:hypothetical protein